MKIIPLTIEQIKPFHTALDQVCREKIYLTRHQAPPLAKTKEFFLEITKNNSPAFIAVDNNQVIGWCDVAVHKADNLKHSGTLGMGIIANYRGKGLGTALLKETINAAKKLGLERIQLEVMDFNDAAYKLYKKFGFTEEGRKKRGAKIEGKYADMIMMGLLLDET